MTEASRRVTAAAKVICLAVDSAERDLVLRWSEEGVLPTFRRLQTAAARCAPEGFPGIANHGMWPSFFTAVSPARHGRYAPAQLVPGGYQDRRCGVDDVRRAPFWSALSAAGRRVAVVNVPKAPLSEDLNGLQLADWGTHDYDFGGIRSWPPDLAAAVEARYGRDTMGKCDHRHLGGIEDYRVFHAGLVERVRRSADFAVDTLSQGPWDLFLMAFGDSHCVGHQCWHLHDPAHQHHDPEIAAALGNPVREVYVAIDAALGRILACAGPETQVLVFVGPGMEANHTGNLLLDPILRRLEAAYDEARRTPTDVLRAAYNRLPMACQRPLGHWAKRTHVATVERDRRRRLCFSVPNHSFYGAIRLNLIGREPDGRLAPGAASDALCRRLTADLLKLTNLDSGKPAVRRVIRSADVLRGEYIDTLPDLFVEWDRAGPIARVGSPEIGELHRPHAMRRSGDHTNHCLLYASGPGIVPGPIKAPVSIVDIAPTIAAHLGIRLDDIDGRAVPALVPAEAPVTLPG